MNYIASSSLDALKPICRNRMTHLHNYTSGYLSFAYLTNVRDDATSSRFSQIVFLIDRRRSSRRDIETKVTIAILPGLPTATFRIILQIRKRCKFTGRFPIRVNINTMFSLVLIVLLFRFVRLHVSVSVDVVKSLSN